MASSDQRYSGPRLEQGSLTADDVVSKLRLDPQRIVEAAVEIFHRNARELSAIGASEGDLLATAGFETYLSGLVTGYELALRDVAEGREIGSLR